ncbi:hypothetical protein WOLCODRAFT_130280 [Wolfiporia cocos MD-104 SS10]|uniref:Acyl-CoA desaturase n=1 Tax=Wolfiporia cocos (strain MD-104) TaxID=742152 RepID=A0A2H3IW75_WOLCO|nr:hypothetical protein WOLCODRAFT_130280 [Wolfiporia cocos MD-104 SS10]
MVTADQPRTSASGIWWANGTFFVLMHVAAAIGIYYYPVWSVPRATLALCFVVFQLAELSITVGYHRLYSHRAFRAAFGIRLVLAILGASAMQGSIKWYRCLRHRLHHRFTDDPVHDPYAATRGLLWSHMGWIFFKRQYERMELLDRDDLDNDPVVRVQHKYYVPLALTFGMIIPPIIGTLWKDTCGSLVWGTLVARLLIWHSTFLVNSLAHWDGLQPYSDENTSKSNLLLALLTCGEGNHNFHAFPHDYRSGPDPLDWDPSKWTIILLHKLDLAWGLKRARGQDVDEAVAYMLQKEREHRMPQLTEVASEKGEENVERRQYETWSWTQLMDYVRDGSSLGRCVVIIDGCAFDVTGYLGEHPGGAALLCKYSIRARTENARTKEEDGDSETHLWKQAHWAFHGGLNVHSRAAKRRLQELMIARVGMGEVGDYI